MAKLVVLSCEIDGQFDSAENRVVTANVAGHRVELCATHRIGLLIQVGVSPEHAKAYVDAYDRQAGTRGTNPSMAQVIEMLAAGVNGDQAPEEQAQEPAPELVESPPAEDTEVETPAAKKRR